MWDVWDVGCLTCEMFGMWDMECATFAWIWELIYKMPGKMYVVKACESWEV